MFGPKKTKYRKSQRLRGGEKGVATRGFRPAFGAHALKAMSGSEITARQIEAARRAMSRCIKRGGKIWIRVFPHQPITQKAAEVPMGSGKGSLDHYVARVKKGTVLFEMDGVDEATAREAMKLAGQKLPIKCKYVNANEI